MPAKVLRRAQFALKEAMDGGDAADGGEHDKPEPKARGRHKGKGKAKAKALSKKPKPDTCPGEELPKHDADGSDVKVCGADESEEGKPATTTSQPDSSDAKSVPKAGDEDEHETKPKRKPRGTKKAKVDKNDKNPENESAGNEEPPKKKTKSQSKPVAEGVESNVVATDGTTEAKNAKKGTKRKAKAEVSNKETASPQAADPEVAAHPKVEKKSKKPAQTFARRVQPASGLAKAKWMALRGSFHDFIKKRVKYPSTHED